jgi:hypothetical protein
MEIKKKIKKILLFSFFKLSVNYFQNNTLKIHIWYNFHYIFFLHIHLNKVYKISIEENWLNWASIASAKLSVPKTIQKVFVLLCFFYINGRTFLISVWVGHFHCWFCFIYILCTFIKLWISLSQILLVSTSPNL